LRAFLVIEPAVAVQRCLQPFAGRAALAQTEEAIGEFLAAPRSKQALP